MTAPILLLASKSSRRRQLLRQLGVKFSVSAQDIDESSKKGEKPTDLVIRLAEEKAKICLKKSADSNVIILASDTIVVVEKEIFGKPNDRNDAIRMLLHLSKNTHRVLTAVSVNCHSKSKTICSETFVNFRTISKTEAEYYWNTGEPRDKAGAYAIQGFGAVFIERIEGSYSGVMGLPLFETAELLKEFGIDCWQVN
tara:strand:- start:1240 stop:1830 length:591 start_codon:yes stop_codon:yes gene_type:complete